MAKNDGGPAFPSGLYHPDGNCSTPMYPGMTRRQLYAGILMAGDVSYLKWLEDDPDNAIRARARARLMWRMADALIETEADDGK